MHAVDRRLADRRAAELQVRGEPVPLERVAGRREVGQHTPHIGPQVRGQHEAVVQRGAPFGERLGRRLPPEHRDQRPHEQLLHQAHAGVRRHLEGAELQQPQPPGRGVRRVELVDAELGPVRVAGQVDQQMPEQPIDDPERLRLAARSGVVRHWSLVECHLQLVHRIAAALVDPRRLAGRADEQPAEQVRERGVVVPVAEQAGEQVRPPQERAVLRGRPPEHEMVAAAGAGVASVTLECLGAEAYVPGVLVHALDDRPQFGPRRGRVHVHLDHAGIGCDLQQADPRIVRRQVTLQHDRVPGLAGRLLDRREQVEIVLQRAGRREEGMQPAVADLDAQRGRDRTIGGERLVRVGVVRILPDGVAVVGLKRTAGPLRPEFDVAVVIGQSAAGGHRVDDGEGAAIGLPRLGHAVERQPQAERRVARLQIQPRRPQRPDGALPLRVCLPPRAGQRQYEPTRLGGAALQSAGEAAAILGAVDVVLGRIDVDRHLPLGADDVVHVLEGRDDAAGRHRQTLGDLLQERAGLLRPERLRLGQVRQQRWIRPKRLPVGPPQAAVAPPRQRLAWVPLALPKVQQRTGGEAVAKPMQQLYGQIPLVLADGVGGPLGRLHVVDRDERGLTAHRQPHIAGGEVGVDAMAQRVDAFPLVVPVGQGDAGCLDDAFDLHGEVELGLARFDAAADRGGRRR